MFGAPLQNWRQIMQMPQANQFASGSRFPTQNAAGGWQMGAASIPPAPSPAPSAAPPMMGLPSKMLSFSPSQWYAQPNQPMQPPDQNNQFAPFMGGGWM